MAGSEDLPKVELHCHLDGIVTPAMMRRLARSGAELPITAEELQATYPVEGFADFVRWYTVTQVFHGDLDRFRPILALHVESLKRQRVVYAELMIGASELWRHGAQDKLAAFRVWTDDLTGEDLQVELLGVLNRARPVEMLTQIAETYLAFHGAGLLAGVAVAGYPESDHPIEPLRNVLARLHEAGVPIQIHAGEWAGPEAVWDALEHGFPSRIGHGVAIFRDPELVETIRERQIHIEMCPTSNLRFGAIERIEDHPIGQARDVGLSISLNTDCPGPAQSTMTSEYELVARLFGFGEHDFRRILAASLAARFQPRLRGAAEHAATGG